MLTRIFVVAACILAVMVAVKDGRVLRAAGLTGVCTIVERGADGSVLDACRPGRLEGAPNLTRSGCTTAGASGHLEYWRCPAANAAAYTP